MKETLIQLRHEMEKESVAALVIPTSDPHSTEYVCEHFAARKFVSGFTGSAGVLVVCKDCCCLVDRWPLFSTSRKSICIQVESDGAKACSCWNTCSYGSCSIHLPDGYMNRFSCPFRNVAW